MNSSTEGWASVYRAVRRIPAGQVASYGQIAELAGMPGAARQVGWALNALREEQDVPWHRVINAQGAISARGVREIADLQRAMLESEGVFFDARGRLDLERYRWQPRKRSAAKPSEKHQKVRARAGAKK